MRNGAIFTLILAVGLGGLSAYMARDWIQQQARPALAEEAPEPATTVVVAKTPLRFGDPLSADALEAVAWPSDAVPPGSFRTVDAVFEEAGARVVLRPIEVYEPVLAAKISGAGEKATLSRLIEGERRAVTIRVNDVVGVAGFVLPADRVDVLVTRRPDGQEPMTDIVMQNIKVLGIDQDIDKDGGKPKLARAVTVEVTPEQAQKLALAQEVGQLTLALRNEANVAEAKAGTISVSDLSAGGRPSAGAPRAVAGAPARQPTVTVVRGLEASEEEVPAEPAAAARMVSEPRRLEPRTAPSDRTWHVERGGAGLPLAELNPPRRK